MKKAILQPVRRVVSRVAAFIQTHPATDFVALGASLATFAAITLANAPRASIWFDEAFSAYIAQFSFWDIARYTAVDVHPPFYYWTLKVWSSLFGTTDLAYRSLSILFGLGIIVVTFFLVRKLFGRKAAGLTTLFLTVSPMLVRYSDEARMYTLSTLIVIGATYVFIKAMESKSKRLWVWYGVLVSLGMWTHYFTALAWLAHWAWWAIQKHQKGESFKQTWKRMFTKEWVLAYGVAVGVFVPWLIVMVRQLGIVQGGGFWIGPVGVDTVANYLSNTFYYLEHAQVQSWLAVGLLGVVAAMALAIPKAYKSLRANEKRWYVLIALLAWLPPLLLFVVSLPPVRPSFVERYLVPATVAFMIFLAVTLLAGTKAWRPFWRALPIVVTVAMMVFGIANVYKYGNFNKNSNTHILTRQVVEKIQAESEPGVPIVAMDPWVFYEAVPYTTSDHPVYYIGEATDFKYGSLEMLKDNDLHKIVNLSSFESAHKKIWYIANSDKDVVPAYKPYWQAVRTVGMYDDITGKTVYKATEYIVSQ